jgi:hypothetical protein
MLMLCIVFYSVLFLSFVFLLILHFISTFILLKSVIQHQLLVYIVRINHVLYTETNDRVLTGNEYKVECLPPKASTIILKKSDILTDKLNDIALIPILNNDIAISESVYHRGIDIHRISDMLD